MSIINSTLQRLTDAAAMPRTWVTPFLIQVMVVMIFGPKERC